MFPFPVPTRGFWKPDWHELEVFALIDVFTHGDIVLCSLGFIGSILVAEWGKIKPGVTFIHLAGAVAL
jgi:hypothetical protein